MRILSLILALAIAASGFSAGRSSVAAVASNQNAADEHACCTNGDPGGQDEKKSDPNDCCGTACLMLCCRTVTPPVNADQTLLDVAPLAARVTLPPLLANDLGEPQAIFHPPRA